MARIANTLSRYEAIGIRENLSDVIYTISPFETPVLSNAGKIKVTNTDFEWQTDALAAAGANAQLDADDVTSFSSTAVTTRLKNYTQISRKDILISGTLEATNRAGRQSEMAYQAAKRGKELKRDMEATITSNVAANAGAAATARTTGTLLSAIKTNTSKGAGGADPTTIITTTRTDGTQRALTETLVKTVAQSVWNAGGELKMAVMGGLIKQKFSTLAGIAQLRKETAGAKAATIVGAADVYVSDFGNLSLVPDRFCRVRDVLFLDPDYYSIATLRPFQTIELAKTGDAEKRMMLVEWGLQIGNEAALGGVFDIDGAL
jgi:hypothetical protein